MLLNMRRRDNRNARMELLPEEIKDAEEEIVLLAQRKAFYEEYTALRSGKPSSKKSQLIKLNPCIDEDGIIRCDGRLKFLPYDTRFPIILPRGHWVTKLIVKNYHERGSHECNECNECNECKISYKDFNLVLLGYLLVPIMIFVPLI